MPYGLGQYGQGQYGGGHSLAIGVPFYATYASIEASVTPRDGTRALDLNAMNGRLIKDSRSGLSLVSGHDRLLSRVLRALETQQGSFFFEPYWGSTFYPGQTVPEQIALEIMAVVLFETRRLRDVAPVPGESFSDIRVTAVAEGNDPRSWDVDVLIYDNIGNSSPAQFNLVR